MIGLLITAIIMGISKAIQNALIFYPTGWLSKYYTWWLNVPAVTYVNKDKPKNAVLRWLLQNPFVFITDAWHCADFIVFMGIPMWATIYYHNYYIVLFFYLAFTIPFSVLFNFLKPKT